MAAKKTSSLVIEIPEDLMMLVVKAAKNDGETVHSWVNPRVEAFLREAVK